MPFAEVNGIALHYRIDGQTDGPWLTLAHGLATDLSMWDELVDVVATRYRVLRFDARGHGRSKATTGDYSFDLLVGDAIGLLDALGVDRTHFVGLSMGGMVALGLALQHPERLISICVCDARAEATEEYNDGWRQRVGIVRERGMRALVDRTLTRWFTPDFLARPSPRLEKMRAMMAQTSTEGYCGCAAALQKLDFARRLHEIKLPALYVVGDQDLGAPPPVVREMHRRTPGSEYVEIADAGHISAVEQPQAFSSAILRFLGRH
ncbi:MAG TPA: 3-oxoadipate enol-lactonase [Xanthobacteraceae bacterium]|nr:3-oxoadipate enol-lactonase [Xanthobacteraceae bacterium]